MAKQVAGTSKAEGANIAESAQPSAISTNNQDHSGTHADQPTAPVVPPVVVTAEEKVTDKPEPQDVAVNEGSGIPTSDEQHLPVAPILGDEDLAKPEKQMPEVQPTAAPAGTVQFKVKPEYRWNEIQSAGIVFSKAEWLPISKDDPRVAELEANPYLEKQA